MTKKSSRKKNKEEMRTLGRKLQETTMKETGPLSYAKLSDEAKKLLASLDLPHTLDEVTSIMRKLHTMYGTDNSINDNDPYGDGDQRGVGELDLPGEGTRQIPRELWGKGGDITHYLINKAFTPLAYNCAIGNTSQVEDILKAATNAEERKRLLERRESGMRLPPLILTIAFSKCKPTVTLYTKVRVNDMDHVGVVKVLLKYGCRPESKEVTGKTVCHYGSGNYATGDTLTMVDYCVDAAKTSSYFQKNVILKNLSKEEYNGISGVLGGYVAATGRRQVILANGKELAVLPKNIFVSKESKQCIVDASINLVDIPDRLGTVCLHEVAMGARENVATFLCKKHNASLDVVDRSGLSVRKMAYTSSFMPTPVHVILRKHAMKQSVKEQFSCVKCKKFVKTRLVCSKCKAVAYCSASCQREDWKDHKKVCTSPELNAIKLDRPRTLIPGGKNYSMSVSGIPAQGDYRRPDGVAPDNFFFIKVQDSSGSLLIYDKTRTCTFMMFPQDKGYNELLQKVQAEKGAQGLKCHMQASFDAAGDCKVYPSTATLLKW